MSGVAKYDDPEYGKIIGSIDTNDWMMYISTIQAAGRHRVEYRVAAADGYGGTLTLKVRSNGGGFNESGTVSIPATAGWFKWITISHVVVLDAGPITFNVTAQGHWNIAWFRITNIDIFQSQDAVIEVFEEFIGCAVSSLVASSRCLLFITFIPLLRKVYWCKLKLYRILL